MADSEHTKRSSDADIQRRQSLISGAFNRQYGTNSKPSSTTPTPALTDAEENKMIDEGFAALQKLSPAERVPIEKLISHLIQEHFSQVSQRQTATYSKEGYTDPLTGLPNRNAFNAELESTVAEGKGFSIAFIDLDDFKTINNTLGHAVGDSALKVVADFLLKHTRKSDFISTHFDPLDEDTHQQSDAAEHMSARLGGDEFVLILKSDRADLLEKRIQKMQEDFDTLTFEHNGEHYPVKGSIGIAHCQAGMSTEDCLEQYKAADKAMYTRKNERKAEIIDQKANEEFEIERLAAVRRFRTMINVFQSRTPQ